MNCVYSHPFYFDNTDNIFRELVAGSNPVHFQSTYTWVYKNVECDNASTTGQALTLIKNETTGAEFYAEKSLSYGDAMIIWFLSLFTLCYIFKKIWDFWWKR